MNRKQEQNIAKVKLKKPALMIGKRSGHRSVTRKRQRRAGSEKAGGAVQGGISCMAEHGKRADCSRNPEIVKAAIRLARRAGHKVNADMLGSSRECMATHGEMADCSQVIGDTRANQIAVLGEEMH